MEIIGIIILMLIVLGIISSIINPIKQKRYDEEAVRNIGPAFEKGLLELETSAADMDLINRKVEELKELFEKNKIIIKNENDEIINMAGTH